MHALQEPLSTLRGPARKRASTSKCRTIVCVCVCFFFRFRADPAGSSLCRPRVHMCVLCTEGSNSDDCFWILPSKQRNSAFSAFFFFLVFSRSPAVKRSSAVACVFVVKSVAAATAVQTMWRQVEAAGFVLGAELCDRSFDFCVFC